MIAESAAARNRGYRSRSVPDVSLRRSSRCKFLNLAVGQSQFRDRGIAALGKLGKEARRAFDLLTAELGPGSRCVRAWGKARRAQKRISGKQTLRRVEIIDDTAQSQPVPMIGRNNPARERTQTVQTNQRTHGEDHR